MHFVRRWSRSQKRSVLLKEISSSMSDTFQEAIGALRKGGVVAFPTETVYGLGANGLNEASVRRIFELKGRPLHNPLILHVPTDFEISKLFDFSPTKSGKQVQNLCHSLISTFWPGPLTIVHRAKSCVPSIVTGGTGFVGLRSPNHAIAQMLLKSLDFPLAAPSANKYGHISPTSREHVEKDFPSRDFVVLDDFSSAATTRPRIESSVSDGDTGVGIESTVCLIEEEHKNGKFLESSMKDEWCVQVGSRSTQEIPQSTDAHQDHTKVFLTILRRGAITSSQIREAIIKPTNSLHALGRMDIYARVKQLDNADPSESSRAAHSAGQVSPGQDVKHYSPSIPTYILSRRFHMDTLPTIDKKDEASLSVVVVSTSSGDMLLPLGDSCVLDFGGRMLHLRDRCGHYMDLSPQGNVRAACSRLYAFMRLGESVGTQQATPRGEGHQSVSYMLLPDMSGGSRDSVREDSKDSELESALWERFHRAASGVYAIIC